VQNLAFEELWFRYEATDWCGHLKQIESVSDGLLTFPNLEQFGLLNSKTRGYKITQIYPLK